MVHSPGFLKLVDEVRPRIKEISVDQARSRLAQNPKAVLIDVREDHEWQIEHAADAVHLGRGIFERDLEQRYSAKDQELILYCGGGYRSALAAASAQQMGYGNVASIIGGYKTMLAARWPMSK